MPEEVKLVRISPSVNAAGKPIVDKIYIQQSYARIGTLLEIEDKTTKVVEICEEK